MIANDTGGDTESLAVTNVSSNATGNSGNAAQGVLGTYGTLTVAADGSYTYVANTAAAEALDAGDKLQIFLLIQSKMMMMLTQIRQL